MAAAVAVSASASSRWSLSSSSSSSSSSSLHSSADPRLGFTAGPARLRFARLIWNGQKSERRTTRAAASSCPVIVAAAAAAAVAETEEPVVTTETVPRPKKIGKGIVRLRLARFGRRKRPFFRIVATHYSRARDGKYIELLGHYNPLHAKDDLGIVVKADRIKYWLGVGAQPSDTVTGILHKVGILKKEMPSQVAQGA